MKVSLKAARVNAGLKQSDVAKALDISIDKVKYIEKNSERIDYLTLIKMCRLYGATTDDIFLPINYPESEVNKDEMHV